VIVGALGTEFAVFTTATASSVDNSAQIYIFALEMLSDFVSCRCKFIKIAILKKGKVVIPCKTIA
jgi:hypothetical protein